MLRYLFVDITLYDSRLFYAYTVVSVVYCSFLGIRLRIYDWTSGKGSRLGRQCACSVVRFAFLGLIVYMKRKNQKRKKKKKDYTRLSWRLACSGYIHVHLHSYSSLVDTACLHSGRFCQYFNPLSSPSTYLISSHPETKSITPKQHCLTPPQSQQSPSPQQAPVQQPLPIPQFPTSSQQPH